MEKLKTYDDYKHIITLPRIVRRYLTFARQADTDIFPDGQQRFARDKQLELLGQMKKGEWQTLVDFGERRAKRLKK